MTDVIEDEALIARFRDWLRESRREAEQTGPGPEPTGSPADPGPEFGLYRLVEEFTALRHEVKLETKGSRGLQEQLEALLPEFRRAVELLRTVTPREEQAALAAARPLAEAIADLDEALDRGRLEVEKARDRAEVQPESTVGVELDQLFEDLPWYRRIGLRVYHDRVREIVDDRPTEPAESSLLRALLEGYSLIQGRLHRAMTAEQVRRIDAVGLPVDPSKMNVSALVDAPGLTPGLVVDEVRRGYTWRGRVLRFAEVRAARARPDETNKNINNIELDAELE